MELPLYVDKVTLRKDNGYALLACYLNKESSLYTKELEKTLRPLINKQWGSITVPVKNLDIDVNPEGCEYIFVGEIKDHPKFGRQFNTEFFYQDIPQDIKSMRGFLLSLPNIGPERSLQITMQWGVDEIINILNNDPEKLLVINGITTKRLPAIIEAWQKTKLMKDLYDFLIEHNISHSLAYKIYDMWGDQSIKVMMNNPYKLTEIYGVGFNTADAIAHKILGNVPKKERLIACMHYILKKDLVTSGNLCMPYNSFKNEMASTIEECQNYNGDVNEYIALFNKVLKEESDLFNVVKRNTTSYFVYLQDVLKKEEYVTETLFDLSKLNSVFTCVDDDIDKSEKDIRVFTKNDDFRLDPKQKEAVSSVFKNKITVITGGGGTGKSTISRCIYTIARRNGLSTCFMSPTGKAAKVLADKTEAPTGTIHRMLKMLPGQDEPEVLLTQNIILIDEISMAGLDIMYALMRAIEYNNTCNIVFVGDPNQLPSVSPGNFLTDLMNSNFTNIVKLDRIHRQGETSYIPIVANDIAAGKSYEFPTDATDIKYHHVSGEEYKKYITKFIEEYLDSNTISDLQIISPQYKGLMGVDTTNTIVQEIMSEYNKSYKMMEYGFKKFFKGDRVLQLDNNYDKEVFNGDLGTVVDLGEKIIDRTVSDKIQKYIIVDFYGREVLYVGDEILQSLTLAWCCTVHKFQGSQSKHIVFLASSEFQYMMNKELVYTAITRAEKLLHIIGDYNMIRLSANRSSIKTRYTHFNELNSADIVILHKLK